MKVSSSSSCCVAGVRTINNKRTRCICERDLYFDDCDCGFEEELLLQSAKKHKDTFLLDYPTLIFPKYKDYTTGATMEFWRLGSPPPTKAQQKSLMITAVKDKMRHMMMWDQQGDYSEELKVLEKCLMLLEEFHSMPGYEFYKKMFDEKRYYQDGKLRWGNFEVGNIVGEVTDYVTPSPEIEGIIDPFVKAIAVVEKYETSDGFLEAWNGGGIFKHKGENANARFLYLGRRFKMYIGRDTKLSKEGQETAMERVSYRCDTQGLVQFWDNAWNTVKAMLIIDCLHSWSYNYHISRLTGPFDFDFDD
jgi:hypothetical protein